MHPEIPGRRAELLLSLVSYLVPTWLREEVKIFVDADWRNMLHETSLVYYWITVALQAMKCSSADFYLGMSTCMQFHQVCGLTDGPN